MQATLVVTIACAGSMLAGCHWFGDAPPKPTTTTGARVEAARRILNDDAAMIITKARCQRKAACNDIGPAGRFDSRDACLGGLFPHESFTLRGDACPAGIDEQQLSRCVDDRIAEPCEQAIVGAGEPPSCDALVLCASPAEP